MDASAWGFIGTLFGALVGASASIATTFFNNRHAAALHGRASELEREQQRRTLQRETLLKLQDQTHRLLRAVTRTHLADKAAFRSTGKWAGALLPTELNDSHAEAVRDFSIQIERVADDALRGELKNLLPLMHRVTVARTEAEGVAAYIDIAAAGDHAMDGIGAALRSQL